MTTKIKKNNFGKWPLVLLNRYLPMQNSNSTDWNDANYEGKSDTVEKYSNHSVLLVWQQNIQSVENKWNYTSSYVSVIQMWERFDWGSQGASFVIDFAWRMFYCIV